MGDRSLDFHTVYVLPESVVVLIHLGHTFDDIPKNLNLLHIVSQTKLMRSIICGKQATADISEEKKTLSKATCNDYETTLPD